MSLSASLNVFAPARIATSAAVLQPTFTEVVSAQILPQNTAAGARRIWALMLSVVGASEIDLVEVWKGYVASYSIALFPDLMANVAVTTGLTLVALSDAQVSVLSAIWTLAEQAVDGPSAARFVNALLTACRRFIPQLPLPARVTAQEALYVGDSAEIRVIYAHYSLVIYLAGKLITDANRNSIEVARPRALISKYRLSNRTTDDLGGVVTTLNGETKLSREAHLGISRAWMEMTGFRINALSMIIEASATGTQIAHDILYTTISLMSFAQMTHAVFCRDLIAAEPWIEHYPPLAPAVAVFKASALELLREPPTLRPYVKVIYMDRAKYFPRRDMLSLVECAIADLRIAGSTMMNYFSDASRAGIVTAFRAERARRHAIAAGPVNTAVPRAPTAPTIQPPPDNVSEYDEHAPPASLPPSPRPGTPAPQLLPLGTPIPHQAQPVGVPPPPPDAGPSLLPQAPPRPETPDLFAGLK